MRTSVREPQYIGGEDPLVFADSIHDVEEFPKSHNRVLVEVGYDLCCGKDIKVEGEIGFARGFF